MKMRKWNLLKYDISREKNGCPYSAFSYMIPAYFITFIDNDFTLKLTAIKIWVLKSELFFFFFVSDGTNRKWKWSRWTGWRMEAHFYCVWSFLFCLHFCSHHCCNSIFVCSTTFQSSGFSFKFLSFHDIMR